MENVSYYIGYAIGLALFVWFARAVIEAAKTTLTTTNKPLKSSDSGWREDYAQDGFAPGPNHGAFSPHGRKD